MFCEGTTTVAVQKRRVFRRKFAPYVLFYLVSWMFYNFSHPVRNSIYAYVLALAVSVSMVSMILAMAVYTTRQRDEFQQQLLMKAMLWGIAGTMTITTVWGMLETLTNVPKLPILMNFPIFLIIVATAKVVLFRSNRALDENVTNG